MCAPPTCSRLIGRPGRPGRKTTSRRNLRNGFATHETCSRRYRWREPGLMTKRRTSLRIAVLGGGKGSFAAAGDFALAGHETRLWRQNPADVAAHRAQGGTITVVDRSGRRDARLA